MAGDDQGRQRVQSQLLKKLKGVSLEAEEAKKEDGVAGEQEISPALGDLLDNLKIEKSKPRVKTGQGKDGLQGGRGWGKAGEEGEGREKAWSRKDAENVRCSHCRKPNIIARIAQNKTCPSMIIFAQVKTRPSKGADNGATCFPAKASETAKARGC